VTQRQSAAAGVAEDTALEVVVVAVLALARMVMGHEHRLHSLEQLLANQRLMLAGVGDAAVGQHAGVVEVVEHRVHAVESKRFGRSPGAASVGQTSRVLLLKEVGKRPVPG
jgi:hypothetical protein